MRLSVTLVSASRSYQPQLSQRATVGQLARYLTRIEPCVESRTLELARPLALDLRPQDVEMQGGDRFVVFSTLPEMMALPAPAKPGDKFIKISAEHFEADSQGKHEVIIGRSDAAQGMIPDVDLRAVVPPTLLPFVSRQCLALRFDPPAQQWYAVKLGQTRLLIDEYEVENQPIPLNHNHWLRLYRATEQPRTGASPIAELLIAVQTVAVDVPAVPFGQQPVPLRLGFEDAPSLLNTSEYLPFQQIVTALAQYQHTALAKSCALYQMRLLSPTLSLVNLPLRAGECLYAACAVRDSAAF